ncbi:type I-E CRISPR-associated protein Cse1/CasA [Mitsuokella jalaludinii]|uniref:type I-E CRISPR-associated protein Cse1/CasA n=1 Tax=Mitsuokella jalaludinii TaxID=187979 RepID=UPI00056A2089|nr:type I-E CRISPR-associated protein Cse1/CasA [Mitsuokella jalaludinii]
MDGKEPEMEFNLLDEPWIIVKTKTNETKTWSILELFEHAHEAQELAGELPTQDIAIMRLLLAIMHGAFVTDEIETADDAIDLWTSMWEEKQFRFDEIKAYLETYHDRFWLFHPTQPFYQSAHIKQNMDSYKEAKGKKVSPEIKWKTVARLVGDLFQSDNKARLFPMRTGKEQEYLTYAEAARWLLHLNGFDDNSAKMPVPKGPGYLAQLGLLYAKGRNLFETLMLNFVLVDDRDEVFADGDEDSKAYWEKPIYETIEQEISQPRAQKDLLTMQSRRIFLRREQGVVTGYLLTMGDYFAKDASLLNETMTVWSEDKIRGFLPKEHQLKCQIWRDFSSLLGMNVDTKSKQPGVIHWLQLLDDEIEEIKPLHICITGTKYKWQSPAWQFVDYIQDSLAINASLLDKMNEVWIQEIVKLLVRTENAVRSFGNFATNLAEVSGDSLQENSLKKKQEIRKAAEEEGYYHLDQVFRRWLRCIAPDKDELEKRTAEWLSIAKKTLLQLAQEELSQCSETAIVGKVKEGNVQNAIKAFQTFRYHINQALG